MGFDTVTIRRNGTAICADPISENVRKGAYNSMNWHRYAEMVCRELRQQNDVTFEIDRRLAAITFEWRKWLYISVETIYFHIMLIVRQCFSHSFLDLPREVVLPLCR